MSKFVVAIFFDEAAGNNGARKLKDLRKKTGRYLNHLLSSQEAPTGRCRSKKVFMGQAGQQPEL